jgi:predicted GTPase
VFFRPTRHVCLVGRHRAGDESTYHPGEANLRMANVVVITKEDSAPAERIEAVRRAARALAPAARGGTAFGEVLEGL